VTKCKANRKQARTDPEDSRGLKLPDLKKNRHVKVVSLSTINTAHL